MVVGAPPADCSAGAAFDLGVAWWMRVAGRGEEDEEEDGEDENEEEVVSWGMRIVPSYGGGPPCVSSRPPLPPPRGTWRAAPGAAGSKGVAARGRL